MKNIKTVLFILGLAFILSGSLSAQPLPGEQQNGSSTAGAPINGQSSAPLGGGVGILVSFGIAYAVSRYNVMKKEAK